MIDPSNLPEIIFSTSDKKLSKQIKKLEREGIVTKIAPRVYTPNLAELPERVIRRNYLVISCLP